MLYLIFHHNHKLKNSKTHQLTNSKTYQLKYSKTYQLNLFTRKKACVYHRHKPVAILFLPLNQNFYL